MRWLLVILICIGSSHADVTRKMKTSMYMMGDAEVAAVSYIAGDRAADMTTTTWLSGMMKTVAGKKPIEATTIVRLDKEVIWTLDPKKKTYTEMTFAEFREQMQKAAAEMEEAEAEEPPEPETEEPEEELYNWTVESCSEPDPRTINGWNCRNVKVIAPGVNKQEPRDKVWITMDFWKSTEIPGQQEAYDYTMRYLKALGMNEQALYQGLAASAAMYMEQMNLLFTENSKVPGEPVKSIIEIKVNKLSGPSVKDAVADAAKDELMGKLPFGKKKSEPKEPTWEEKIKFRSENELVEVSLDPAPPSTFEIPAGYKKK
jgi:hypothetical protein